MTNDKSGEDIQPKTVKSQETFSPVTLTDSVGALFLGVISIILLAVVGGLLVRNHKLEDRLREFGK